MGPETLFLVIKAPIVSKWAPHEAVEQELRTEQEAASFFGLSGMFLCNLYTLHVLFVSAVCQFACLYTLGVCEFIFLIS